MGGVQRGSRAKFWGLACLAWVLALGCGRTDKNGEPATGPDTTQAPANAPNCAVAVAGNDGRHCAVYLCP